MISFIRFTWHKSDRDGKRVYTVWDTLHGKQIYQGGGYVTARKVYNRAVAEAERMDEYNAKQEVEP